MREVSKRRLLGNPLIRSMYRYKIKIRRIMIRYLIVFNLARKYLHADMKPYLKLITKHKYFTIKSNRPQISKHQTNLALSFKMF